MVVDVEPLKRCRKCNALLGNPSGFIGQLITDLLLNPELLVTLFRLPVQTCKNCGSENVASHKDCPENGQFGYNIMALVSMLKHKGRLTYRKICWFFKNMFNMDFTPATALELDSRTASKVSGEYSKLVGNIRGSDYVNIDETGAKVNGEKGHYTWGFITKDTTLLVTRKSRGKNILEEILGINYVGIIICDGYKAYQNFTRFLQRCWAHILREIKYLAEDLPQAVPLYRELKTLYKWAVERYRKRMNKKQRRIMWIRAKYRLRIILSRYATRKPLQKPLQKIHNGLDHWFTFILHPEIEPTNNIAERGIRETVVQRKIYGCLRNEKGTRNHDVLSSLIATWEQRGLNPYTQLQQTLRS